MTTTQRSPVITVPKILKMLLIAQWNVMFLPKEHFVCAVASYSTTNRLFEMFLPFEIGLLFISKELENLEKSLTTLFIRFLQIIHIVLHTHEQRKYTTHCGSQVWYRQQIKLALISKLSNDSTHRLGSHKEWRYRNHVATITFVACVCLRFSVWYSVYLVMKFRCNVAACRGLSSSWLGHLPRPGLPTQILLLLENLLNRRLQRLRSQLFRRPWGIGLLWSNDSQCYWKKAIVFPIYKGGARSVVTNYRPFSLASVACTQMDHLSAGYLRQVWDKSEWL
jgi:hypothetical protein